MNVKTPTVDSLHVLVIEDETVTREIMQAFLEAVGVKSISLAANGREALEILQNKNRAPIDVAFCDIHMPEMDGVEFIRRASLLKQQPALVIVSVAHEAFLSTIADMGRSRGMNVLEWVVKPITRERIENILTEYCGVLAAIEREKSAGIPAADFKAAFDRNEWRLHYQPIVSARTGAVEAFEALIRWSHPTYGLLWPQAFMREADTFGMAGALTDWAIEAAFEQCANWEAGGLHTKIALNLALPHITDSDLPRRLAARAAKSGIKADRIIFEITESAIVSEGSDRVLTVLRGLREAGFSLSIDDFGTSFSALTEIPALPFNIMKVDRALTMNCVGDPRAREIITSSIELAQKLGMSVVAEGVESEGESKLLTELGVDDLQGFVLARPMPVEDVVDWVAQRPAAI